MFWHPLAMDSDGSSIQLITALIIATFVTRSRVQKYLSENALLPSSGHYTHISFLGKSINSTSVYQIEVLTGLVSKNHAFYIYKDYNETPLYTFRQYSLGLNHLTLWRVLENGDNLVANINVTENSGIYMQFVNDETEEDDMKLFHCNYDYIVNDRPIVDADSSYYYFAQLIVDYSGGPIYNTNEQLPSHKPDMNRFKGKLEIDIPVNTDRGQAVAELKQMELLYKKQEIGRAGTDWLNKRRPLKETINKKNKLLHSWNSLLITRCYYTIFLLQFI